MLCDSCSGTHIRCRSTSRNASSSPLAHRQSKILLLSISLSAVSSSTILQYICCFQSISHIYGVHVLPQCSTFAIISIPVHSHVGAKAVSDACPMRRVTLVDGSRPRAVETGEVRPTFHVRCLTPLLDLAIVSIALRYED